MSNKTNKKSGSTVNNRNCNVAGYDALPIFESVKHQQADNFTRGVPGWRHCFLRIEKQG